MSSKVPPTLETQDERQEEAEEQTGPEVLLRDESDEIIDHLKSQLNNLQQQLQRYKRTDRDRPGGEGEGGWREAWQAGLTPHIASRLQMPAEELTARLERLVDEVGEPHLRDELEKSRDTAFFLFDTFRRISEKHDQLTESLTADTLVVAAEELRARFEQALEERELPVTVATRSPLPARMMLSPQSLLTVLTTLADLAVDLFGGATRLELSCPEPGEGGERRAELSLRVTSERAWEGLEHEAEVTTVAIRHGMRSHAVVDLLYVEKIIEMRGGSLGFFRQGGRVHGFEVAVPVTVLGDAPGEPDGSGR